MNRSEKVVPDFCRMGMEELLMELDQGEGRVLVYEPLSGLIGLHNSDCTDVWITDNGFAIMAFFDLKEKGRIESIELFPVEDMESESLADFVSSRASWYEFYPRGFGTGRGKSTLQAYRAKKS